MATAVLLTLGALACIYVYQRNSSAARDDVAFVPGPENDSFLTGNMYTLAASPSDRIAMTWSKQYGGVVRLHGVLGVKQHVLLISDPAALRRLFSSSSSFDLSSRNLASFKSLFGPGIAAVEGADHQRQRRVIAQALTPIEVRGMLDPVQAVSKNLRSALRKTLLESNPNGPTQLDMLDWARRVALDSLTMFAFGVPIHAIDAPEKIHDILHTFDAMLEDCLGKSSTLKYFLRETAVAGIYPSLLGIALTDPTFFRSMIGATKRLGEFSKWVRATRAEQDGSGNGNDILSLLAKSKAPTEKANKGESKYKLADDEIRAQIGMVLFAGHDTVSTTLAMFLTDMGRFPEVQAKLREEILAKQAEVGGEDVPFTQEDYESMPYLNAVLKESMRLNPALGQTFRTNRSDDVLPLSEPIRGTDGKMRDQIAVSAGTVVVVDIASSNRRKDVWGDDADDFRPERWLKEDAVLPLTKTPGVVYGSVLNFLAGNRTCPGWRIAVLQLQAFICDLILGFRISQVPGVDIIREFHGVTIPKVHGNPVRGGEVPLVMEAL
ncbi:cytochrome P450 [Vararia minispora EC-137]|uniref:Cytochrome P450 n=1 Tax=Vararia minispora EC-137 TaxID=1314806 RepID=A0ACB8QID2_9AGAM|nr:cytochrome P450 [Vararia minispora EC-137]